jgi:hypothetical protein
MLAPISRPSCKQILGHPLAHAAEHNIILIQRFLSNKTHFSRSSVKYNMS